MPRWSRLKIWFEASRGASSTKAGLIMKRREVRRFHSDSCALRQQNRQTLTYHRRFHTAHASSWGLLFWIDLLRQRQSVHAIHRKREESHDPWLPLQAPAIAATSLPERPGLPGISQTSQVRLPWDFGHPGNACPEPPPQCVSGSCCSTRSGGDGQSFREYCGRRPPARMPMRHLRLLLAVVR